MSDKEKIEVMKELLVLYRREALEYEMMLGFSVLEEDDIKRLVELESKLHEE